MKYLSIVFFALALSWSWRLIHSSPSISLETHYAIQQNLGQLILESLMKLKPAAQNAKIEKIWSEVLEHESVLVHFVYSFTEGDETAGKSNSTIQGHCTLRKGTTESGDENWVASQFTTTNNAIVFEDGAVISGEATKNQ